MPISVFIADPTCPWAAAEGSLQTDTRQTDEAVQALDANPYA